MTQELFRAPLGRLDYEITAVDMGDIRDSASPENPCVKLLCYDVLLFFEGMGVQEEQPSKLERIAGKVRTVAQISFSPGDIFNGNIAPYLVAIMPESDFEIAFDLARREKLAIRYYDKSDEYIAIVHTNSLLAGPLPLDFTPPQALPRDMRIELTSGLRPEVREQEEVLKDLFADFAGIAARGVTLHTQRR